MRTDPETGLPLYLPENTFTATMPLTGAAASGGTGMGRQFMQAVRANRGSSTIGSAALKTFRAPKETHLRIAGKGLRGALVGALAGGLWVTV